MSPLYDTVNFNCLGLSALTPVQPPEGTRELTERAYGIEWEKATVVHLSSSSSSSSSMTAHSQLLCHCHAVIKIRSFLWQPGIISNVQKASLATCNKVYSMYLFCSYLSHIYIERDKQ